MRGFVTFTPVAVMLATPALADSRSFPVGSFDRIQSSVPFDVHVRTGAAVAVHADGSRDVLDQLAITVRDGELRIEIKRRGWFSGWSFNHGGHATIDVTVPGLRGAALSGPGNLTVDRVRAPRFAAALSGPGNLTIGEGEARQVAAAVSGPGDLRIAGHAEEANAVLSGPGNLRAAGFSVRDLTVTLSGPGDIEVAATRSATGHLSGPGNIRVTGGARCQISKNGPGSVRCG